ncbi:nitrilase-related carbon-nitrogen hydrolase [Luteimonas kalidii]|uniref:Nitrilase-related carbon-nitrogen hydrolase n=1 Tax=Luteimonas kalidii TaxID=3042025 RepID=A0ABT6JPJ0_9GAMM|nr:nitrilase-related carbon-nitrogen hydrolase [Luteimonas kalidii]MDH5832600.1 nitrilase-related carbon-nitrogen hydrolase [Luteimonas kalidii]
MASKPDLLPRWAAPIAVAGTAALWWLAAGLQPLWWAAWLAPVPLLAYVVRARALPSALATVLAFGLGGMTLWTYVHEVIRLPLAACVQIVLTPALLMLPPVLLFRVLARGGRPLAATFSLPLTATGLSWLAAATSPHGTYGHIAYSQMEALPVLQVAAVTGLWGVGFLVWLFAAVIVMVTLPAGTRHARWRAATVSAALVVVALGYGTWRLQADEPVKDLRVGLVSIGTRGGNEAELDTADGQRVLDAYVARMERLVDDGAQLLVAPESSLLVRTHSIPALQALADRRGVRVLMGVEDHSNPARLHNAALLFEPRATQPVPYYKHHFIPVFEDRYTRGTVRTILPGSPRTGVAICKDLDFTSTGLAYARRDVQLLLVPAWDFDVDAWMHGRMAVMRGVEGGFAMARTARNGDLTLSDDRGRVVAEASAAGVAEPVSLVADLPLRDTRTPYRLWGDAFAILCLALATLLAFGAVRMRGRPVADAAGR